MEPAEIGRWFEETAAGLTLYARQIAGAGAEDVVQEVFVRFASQARVPENPRAWLLLAVRRGAIDWARSDRRRAARDRRVGHERGGEMFEGAGEGPASGEVEEALADLALEEREVVTMRIWNGATFEEIAGVMGMPVSSVYHKYRAALETMRARWEAPCRKK